MSLKRIVSFIGITLISMSLVVFMGNGLLNHKEEVPMEENKMIWCPMCQEDTIDMDTHECTQCGYIPEDWEAYLIELGLN